MGDPPDPSRTGRGRKPDGDNNHERTATPASGDAWHGWLLLSRCLRDDRLGLRQQPLLVCVRPHALPADLQQHRHRQRRYT